MIDFLSALAIAGIAALAVATLLADVIGRCGFPLPPHDRRIGCIDGLRGYLALSVMVHHFYIWVNIVRFSGSWRPPPYHFLNELGAGGVALFFMTTGLVFYPRILTGWRSTSWLTVYVTRVFRIVPLVAVAVAAVTAIVMARTGATPDGHYLLAAATWISTIGEPPLLGYADSARINAYVLWSLQYEWLFYILLLPLFAFIIDILHRRQIGTWLLPLTFLGLTIGGSIAVQLAGVPLLLLRYMPLFAVGMLAYECQSRLNIRRVLSRPVVTIAAIGSLAIGMFGSETPYALSLPFFAFFFLCVACGNTLGGLLRFRGALVLGECSFGIYLLHGILLDIVFVDADEVYGGLATAALPVLLPALAIAVVLLTSASYLLIERPAMRAGRNLSRWFTGHRLKLGSQELEVAP